MKEFIDLFVQKDKGSASHSIAKMLDSIVYVPKAYLYAFENIPTHLRPKNTNQLFDVIKQCDDDIFNYYYFTLLEGQIDIQHLRNQSIHRPSNDRLKEHVQELDNPKTTLNLIEGLFSYYKSARVNPTDKKSFDNFLDKNLKTIEKVNKLTSKKSPVAKLFYRWMSDVANHEGMDEVMNLSQKMKVNLINLSKQTGNKLELKIQTSLSAKEFEGYERFFQSATDKSLKKYEILKSSTNCMSCLSFLKENYDKEVVLYFWDIFKQQIRDVANKYHFYPEIKEVKDLGEVEILSVLIADEKLAEKIGIYNFFAVKGHQDDIISRLNYHVLSDKLNTTASVSKKRKI